MNKIVTALAAMLACAIFVPAAHAFDCDADDAADVAECARSVMKAPGIRRLLPTPAGPSASLKQQCDADDAEEMKECMRELQASRANRLPPMGARPFAQAPAERKVPEKVEATPTTAMIVSSEKTARFAAPDDGPLCQKYFPNVGKLVSVPCSQ